MRKKKEKKRKKPDATKKGANRERGSKLMPDH